MAKFGEFAKPVNMDINRIAILVVGQTGVGKSTFINQILQKEYPNRPEARMKVGYSLDACTKDIKVTSLPRPYQGAQIELVDTPGFNRADADDQAVLNKIESWLKTSYKKFDMMHAGIIYLHDISVEFSFSGIVGRTLEYLCGAPAFGFDKLIIGLTKHTRIDPEVATIRERELREEYCKIAVNRGARVFQYGNNYISAWSFINQIIGCCVLRSDLLIPVLGPTGVGKSTFINQLLKGPDGQADSQSSVLMEVGISLSPCTTVIEVVPFNCLCEGARILLVDTPGLDHNRGNDLVVMKQIANLLKNSYVNSKSVFAGAIYLHDISQDRSSNAAVTHVQIFELLCGYPVLDKVIIGTTKHGRVQINEVTIRERELKELWKPLIDKGAGVLPYRDDYESAWAFINQILTHRTLNLGPEIRKESSTGHEQEFHIISEDAFGTVANVKSIKRHTRC